MTDYERARLRLDAWIAISGWGAAMPVGDDAPDWLKFNPPIKSWDWETRKVRANDLYQWLIDQGENEKNEQRHTQRAEEEAEVLPP